MSGRVRFVCLLHSHQPVGNFDHVIEEAYQKSYLPYVEAFEKFPRVPLTHHISGCLLEWLEEKHPEYFARLRGHAGKDAHAWEMVGGGFYEPIMTMLPRRDRHGQIARMQDYIERHFGARPRGLWLPERVWEPALVKDLAGAGVAYLTLDDSHFRAAGLRDDELVGGYVTEDEGVTLRVYPASEKLRYLIPYAQVHEILAYLKELVPSEGERVVCYADDGEKFGVWPDTYRHVYGERWLEKFLEALQQAQDEGWLVCSTLSRSYDEVEPAGRVYLPENSYREMTEWALPAPTLAAYERAVEGVRGDERFKSILPLVKGGNWRNFRVKYAEGGRLYAKMMEVSGKVEALAGKKGKKADEARTHLYRGQCNCPYWHGVFGGMYLPHLRSAIYRELLRAENLADELLKEGEEAEVRDYDFDGFEELKLGNARANLYLHPERGGHLYEFDLRERAFNVGDTFSRRYEAYHDKVARAVVGKPRQDGEQAQSIHELVRAKEPGLAKLLRYDAYLRESLVDHLAARALTAEDLLTGEPPSDPGFRQGAYEFELELPGKKKGGAGSAVLTRAGPFGGGTLHLAKRVRLDGAGYVAGYELTNTGTAPVQGFFGVEFNYSLLAGRAPDRYYYHAGTLNAGPLETAADFGAQAFVGLKDEWLDVALTLRPSVPAQVVAAPVKTVSQSEDGFESIYQSSCVLLQWALKLGPGERFEAAVVQEVSSARV
ncbi:MAG: DUF1926 domain-containing protein [Planctomycetota bacterium]|nr:DUF1926 domain-containing protein [Planctomycetota bacterium]